MVDFGQPLLLAVSLWALFTGPGVAILAGHGGCPGAEPAMPRPLARLCPCAAKTSGPKEGGAVFERITARLGKGVFQPGECAGKLLPGLPPPRAAEERGLCFHREEWKRCVRGPSCARPFGGGAVCWAEGGSRFRGPWGGERSGAKVSWTELTSALFRWSCV